MISPSIPSSPAPEATHPQLPGGLSGTEVLILDAPRGPVSASSSSPRASFQMLGTTQLRWHVGLGIRRTSVLLKWPGTEGASLCSSIGSIGRRDLGWCDGRRWTRQRSQCLTHDALSLIEVVSRSEVSGGLVLRSSVSGCSSWLSGRVGPPRPSRAADLHHPAGRPI